MMKNILCCLFICCASQCIAQLNYAVAFIPDSLKKNASVVKRFEKYLLEVTDDNRASYSAHTVTTVLQEAGASELVFQSSVDRYRSLEDVEINLMDANGNVTNRYRKKDLQSYVIGEDLITDGHLLFFRVPATRYPVTVEFKYTSKIKSILSYPPYYYSQPYKSVQQSSYTAKISKSLELRYKNMNSDLKAQVTEDDKFRIYTWTVKDLPATRSEDGSIVDFNQFPCIKLAPSRFKYDEYAGNLSSWASYGKWSYDLYKDQDKLPAEKIEFFRNLVKGVGSDREKAEILYKYLQDNFRYVSIQLGIGGFKPFSASFTDQKKYGDCKALTNYMLSALKAVGIKSYPATINSGINMLPVDKNFPANFENHVILFVPMKKDTLWLECTSKTNDFGVLGIGTENRNALVLTEEGGKLVATPKSHASDNMTSSVSIIKINENGNGSIDQQFTSSGQFRQMMLYLASEKPDVQKEFSIFQLGFKQPDEFAFTSLGKQDGRHMQIKASFEKVPEFIAGSKMFLSPRLYKFWTVKLPKYDNRKFDYYFDYPFIKTDTTTFEIPEGFVVDALPKSRTLTCAYGNYHSDFKTEGNRIISMVSMMLKDHKIPAAQYNEVRAFMDEVIKEESQRIVIRKNS